MYEGRRAQSPFDDSAADRLRRMDLTDEAGNPAAAELFGVADFPLSRTPPAGLEEPHYKHFSIEKYRNFYELREKNRVVIRVIFTVLPSGEVLLLHAFQKRQSRDTMREPLTDTAAQVKNLAARYQQEGRS